MDFATLTLASIDSVSVEQLDPFSCGTDSLDEFLKNDARRFHDNRLCGTTLVFSDDDPVPVAYFSICADSLQLSEGEKSFLEMDIGAPVPVRFIPAVKITKLAVRSDFQGQGLAGHLLDTVEGLAYGSDISARFIVIDALNQADVIRLYERHGYVRSLYAEEQAKNAKRGALTPSATVKLYKDIFADA